VPPALAEGEEEGAGGEDQPADEGRVEARFRAALGNVLAIKLLLAVARDGADERGDAA